MKSSELVYKIKENEKLKILNKFKDEEKLKQQEIIPLEIEVDDKTRNYLKSSAAQLASTLKEGTPCQYVAVHITLPCGV